MSLFYWSIFVSIIHQLNFSSIHCLVFFVSDLPTYWINRSPLNLKINLPLLFQNHNHDPNTSLIAILPPNSIYPYTHAKQCLSTSTRPFYSILLVTHRRTRENRSEERKCPEYAHACTCARMRRCTAESALARAPLLERASHTSRRHTAISGALHAAAAAAASAAGKVCRQPVVYTYTWCTSISLALLGS